jgi:transposase
MIKAHKIRLHPTPEQATYFAKAAGTARYAFNWALAEWKRQYEAGEKPLALHLRAQFHALYKRRRIIGSSNFLVIRRRRAIDSSGTFQRGDILLG